MCFIVLYECHRLQNLLKISSTTSYVAKNYYQNLILNVGKKLNFMKVIPWPRSGLRLCIVFSGPLNTEAILEPMSEYFQFGPHQYTNTYLCIKCYVIILICNLQRITEVFYYYVMSTLSIHWLATWLDLFCGAASLRSYYTEKNSRSLDVYNICICGHGLPCPTPQVRP